jgi:hypothetical protein
MQRSRRKPHGRSGARNLLWAPAEDETLIHAHTVKHLSVAALGLFAAITTPGCGASDQSIEPDVGELTEALSCGQALNMGICGTYTATSPDASYSACSGASYTGTDTTPPPAGVQGMRLVVRYAGAALDTEAKCEATHLYGSIVAQLSGSLHSGTTWWDGVWNSATSSCSFQVGPWGEASINIPTGIQELRVHGKAWTDNAGGGGVTYKKVTVGSTRTCTPR